MRRLAIVWAVLPCVVLAGCGKGNAPVPVSGRVTVKGSPVENIVVTFTPCGDDAEPGFGSFGRTGPDGRYSLTVTGTGRPGAMVGEHRVTLAYRDEVSFNMTEDEMAKAAATGRIPYAGLPPNTRDGSLRFVVEPGGTDQANFDF